MMFLSLPKGPNVNRKLQSDSYAELVRAYAEAIAVPRFDRNAVERRSPKTCGSSVSPLRQYAFAAVVSIALVAWAAPAVPALIADVQNAVQLFLEHNGQMVPATDRIVTIDEAARDLPFHVVAPSGVPLAATPTIREVSVAGDPMSAQLMIQYASNIAGPKPGMVVLPALTIVEMPAGAPQSNLFFTAHAVGQPPMARMPQPPGNPGGPAPVGAVRIRMLTSTWVANGTRITLMGTPGAITQPQLDAIRRAMGGQ